MSAGRSLPPVAPRGKAFAVARCATPLDPAVTVLDPTWTLLEQASRAAAGIDWRLSPTIVLVDRRPS